MDSAGGRSEAAPEQATPDRDRGNEEHVRPQKQRGQSRRQGPVPLLQMQDADKGGRRRHARLAPSPPNPPEAPEPFLLWTQKSLETTGVCKQTTFGWRRHPSSGGRGLVQAS